MARWRAAARDQGAALRRDAVGDVVFVLGAGASLSSGAPTTSEVHQALSDATSRIPEGELLDRVHDVAGHDKQSTLAPLIERADQPGIGYLCLAALGHRRRVVVLNLNWDPLVSLACERLEVPHAFYDIRERDRWQDADGLPDRRGVLCVHLHGRAGDDSRYGRAETLGYDDAEKAHLRLIASGRRQLVVGASLQDHDIVDALRTVHDGPRSSPDVPTTWFLRASADTEPDEVARLQREMPHTELYPAPDIDFDALAHTVLDQSRGGMWDIARSNHRTLDLPDRDSLVMPRRSLVIEASTGRTVVLVGDPQLGKSTVAMFAAHLRQLWSAVDGPLVRYLDGPDGCVAALAGADDSPAVYVLENPFGEDGKSPNPRFLDLLADAAAHDGGPVLLVTSRLAGWERAVAERGRDVPEPLPATPDTWWDLRSLRRLAVEVGVDHDGLPDEVQPGRLDTPGRVLDRAAGLPVAYAAPNVDRGDAVRQDRLEVLGADRELARLAVVTRLQEFGGAPLPADDIRRTAGEPRTAGAAHDLMLRRYEWEGVPRLRLNAPVDREATDDYLTQNTELGAQLAAEPGTPSAVIAGWKAWNLLELARRGAPALLEGSTAAERGEFGGRLLSSNPTDDIAAVLLDAEHDEWSAADLAYALVRVWDALPAPPRRDLLDALLRDAGASGAYAVLEACLYLRRAADPTVWDALGHALDRLPDDEGGRWQTCLALDGYLWRPPPDPARDLAWLHARMGDLQPGHPLAGALRFVSAYHPDGLDALGFADVARALEYAPWEDTDRSTAARLARWHFLHQSRARAQLANQHWIDKDFLCRGLHTGPKQPSEGTLVALLHGLLGGGEPGWAFHAACNLATFGIDLDGRVLAVVAQALSAAAPRDTGVVTAALTYQYASAGWLAAPVRAWSRDHENRDELLAVEADGATVDDQLVAPPRFEFARDPAAVHAALGLQFGRLRSRGFDTTDPSRLAGRLRPVAARLVADGAVSPLPTAELLRRVERGDLRELEHAAAAFGDTVDADEAVIRAASAEITGRTEA